jgi:uncharacterized protein with PQ loop repeat
MSNDLLVILTGAATAALAVAFGLPQFFRVRRTGSLAGVSLPSVTNTLVSTTAWLFYGLHLQDFWVTLTSVVGLPSLIATFVAIIRRSDDRSGMWLPFGWAGLLAGTAAATPWFPLLFPALLGGSALWYVTPAAVTAWRSADVSGIASGTWLLLAVDGLVAGAYGAAAGVPAYLVYACIALLGALTVLARVYWRWAPECGECAPITGCTCAA